MALGCESIKAAWERDEVKGGVIGTAVGAGAGAIIGAATGHTAAGTAIGAGIGTIGGTLIGGMMQKQKEELNELANNINNQQPQIDNLQKVMAKYESRENTAVFILWGGALFATNSSSVQPGAVNNIVEVAKIIKASNDTKVSVKGYTDSFGDENSNQILSEQRANSVANILISQGISSDRITVIGFGKMFPVAPNDTPEGRLQNRRVEIIVIPPEKTS